MITMFRVVDTLCLLSQGVVELAQLPRIRRASGRTWPAGAAHSPPATVCASTTAERIDTTATQTVATARNTGPLAALPSTNLRLARISM